jgi:hypothetical protein
LQFHVRKNSGYPLLFSLLLMLALIFPATAAWAQNDQPPKIEVYTGYQWMNPGAKFPTFNSNGGITATELPSMWNGATGSIAWMFSKHLGLEGEYGRSFNASRSFDEDEITVSAGPHFEFRDKSDGFSIFVHTLASWNHLTPPGGPRAINDGGAIAGGGIDLLATRRLTVRIIEADYVFARDNFAFAGLGEHIELNGFRLGGGLVWNFLNPQETPPTASCSIQPSEVMVGEPVTATATVTNFEPKHHLVYTWTMTGAGKITGKDTTGSIDTNGLTGGNYVATATIYDPKMKKGATATCTASFTVKEPPKNPPTMSCTASPSSIQPGDTVNVSCNCGSPDNVTVSVSNWTASSGTISGTGATATLNTTGASPGTITVGATCTDNRGLSTQASTRVTVNSPPQPPTPPAPPMASKQGECDFANMTKIGKPWRVDNECKGRLDDVAKNLQQSPDNKLVVVGNAEPKEKRRNLAAERAVNAKAYLTGGEAKMGIDAGRIEPRTGSAGTQTIELWIVPAGASFSGEGTQTVDERKVKAVPDHPHAAPAKKKAKPAAQP